MPTAINAYTLSQQCGILERLDDRRLALRAKCIFWFILWKSAKYLGWNQFRLRSGAKRRKTRRKLIKLYREIRALERRLGVKS